MKKIPHNIHSSAWHDMLGGESLRSPVTRDDKKSDIGFTLETRSVDKNGNTRIEKSEVLKWQT